MNYVIIGTSTYLVNQEVKKIIQEQPYISVDFLNSSIEDILFTAGYNDLFASKKNIIVKNAIFFQEKNEKVTSSLEKYLENPNPNTNLIFINNKANEKLKIYRLLEQNHHLRILKNMYANESTTKLIEEVKKAGYTISYEDARYIIDSSLNNFDIAIQNVEKIFTYYGKPTSILSKDVKYLCSISMNDNQFKFVDAIIAKDYQQVFKIIEDFKIQKVEPFLLLNLLVREFRNMLLVKEATENKEIKNDILSSLSLAKWQLDKLIRNSASYKKSELEKELVDLANLDFAIKMGQIDKYLALELYLIGR